MFLEDILKQRMVVGGYIMVLEHMACGNSLLITGMQEFVRLSMNFP